MIKWKLYNEPESFGWIGDVDESQWEKMAYKMARAQVVSQMFPLFRLKVNVYNQVLNENDIDVGKFFKDMIIYERKNIYDALKDHHKVK